MPSASITTAHFNSALRRPPTRLSPSVAHLPSRAIRLFFPARRIACDAGVSTSEVSSSSSASAVSSSAATAPLSVTPEEEAALSKVGSRVRVKAPLKVYHVPKVPEVELNGLEGVIKQYVALWKGKRISANLPFKVEFVLPDGLEGRPGPLKFVAHLREDEFEYIPEE